MTVRNLELMPPYPNGHGHVTDTHRDAHEERIQRLEENQSEMKAEVVENTVRLEVLNKSVAGIGEAVSDLGQKLGVGFDGVLKRIETVVDKLDKQEGRIVTLETKETARETSSRERWSAAKKLMFWVLGGISAASLGGIGHSIWDHLSRR